MSPWLIALLVIAGIALGAGLMFVYVVYQFANAFNW
jgi:hypothetical protein